MFIRHFIRRNQDGSARVYLYLCRNCMSGGKERQELVKEVDNHLGVGYCLGTPALRSGSKVIPVK